MSKRSNSVQFVNGLRILGACLVVAILTACGGGGSGGSGGGRNPGDGSGGGRRPAGPGTISGVAHDGPIVGATINVYTWNGQRGQLLASTTTDSAGTYSFSLSVPRQPLLLESVGGVYIDEATESNVIVPSGQALLAVQNFDPGQALTGHITYFSTLAAGLAENLVKQGQSADDAVTTANSRIADILGLDLSKAPAVVNNRLGLAAEASASVELGFATAAVSSLTQSANIANEARPNALFTSIGFIQAAYDDIRADGMLDGKGVNGLITLGKISVTPDTYRRQLALNILRTATNPTANRLQVNPAQLVAVATRLNNSTDPIFANAPVTPIDTDKPNIVDLSIGEGQVLFGRGRRIAFSIQSLTTLASVQLLLGNKVAVNMADPNATTASLDTTQFSDGETDFTLVATDAAGGTARRTFKVRVVNMTATVVSDTLKPNQFYNGVFDAQFTINDPAGIAQVQYLIDGAVQQTQTSTDPFRFDTRKLADGPHTVLARVTNVPGAVTDMPISINIDNTPPEVTFSLADNMLVGLRQSRLDLSISATDAVFNAPRLPNVVNAGEFLLDGKGNPIPPANPTVNSNSVTFTQFLDFDDPIDENVFIRIPEGVHTLSFRVSDALNSTFVSRRFTFDRTAPVNQITAPRSCAFLDMGGGGEAAGTGTRTCDTASSGIVTFRGSVRDSLTPVTRAQLMLTSLIDAPTGTSVGAQRTIDLTLSPDGSFAVDVDTRAFSNGRLALGISSANAAGNDTTGTNLTPAGPGISEGFIFVSN